MFPSQSKLGTFRTVPMIVLLSETNGLIANGTFPDTAATKCFMLDKVAFGNKILTVEAGSKSFRRSFRQTRGGHLDSREHGFTCGGLVHVRRIGNMKLEARVFFEGKHRY